MVFFAWNAVAQQYYSLSGYVQDAETPERLVGATLFHPADQKRTTSNTYGYFSLNMPQGTSELQVQYMGYKPQAITINLQSVH